MKNVKSIIRVISQSRNNNNKKNPKKTLKKSCNHAKATRVYKKLNIIVKMKETKK